MVAIISLMLMAAPESIDGLPLYLLQAPDDSEARYSYAQQLWSANRVAEAAAEFRRVAMDPQCRYARDAAYDYVMARQELVMPAPLPRFDGKPWPLTVEKQALVDAVDFFLALRPDDPDAESVAFRAAHLYFEADDFVQAEHRLMWMIFHGYGKDYVLDLFKLIDERRRQQPDGVGESQTIGAPQTIGEPQTIGGQEDLGGDPEIMGSDLEEVGEDFEEYVVP